MRKRVRPGFRRDRGLVAPLMAVVVIILVAMVAFMVAIFVASANDDVNDPTEPPEGCTDEADWVGRFEFSVEYDPSGSDSVEIYQAYMGRLSEYKGMDFDPAAIKPASWGWSDSYDAKYSLVLSHDLWQIKDSGEFKLYKSEDFTAVGKRTGEIHFWEEQTGSWKYRLKVECEGVTDIKEGFFELKSDGTIKV